MESDNDFTRHYIIRYLSARELVLLNNPPPLCRETGRSYPEVLFKALISPIGQCIYQLVNIYRVLGPLILAVQRSP